MMGVFYCVIENLIYRIEQCAANDGASTQIYCDLHNVSIMST